MKEIIITLTIIFGALNICFSQSRWSQNYFEGEDSFAEMIIEDYDGGYLLSGRYGPNYPSYNWLVKTDINGELLWNKVIGNISDYIVISTDMTINNAGSIYLVGSTNTYNNVNYDPIIIKIDSCGEKEWCKVFYEDGNNYVANIITTNDNGLVTVLQYMNTDITKDRISLAKLSSNGDLLWIKSYNSEDTCIYNEDALDLIQCADKGFLITGICDYQDYSPPHSLWTKPYFLKTDSLGNFEWETVLHKGTWNPGGFAWETVISPDSNCFYSALAHKYFNPTTYKAALLKMDFNGIVDTIYDLTSNEDIVSLYGISFINDSLLMGGATWDYGNTTDRKAVIIDTVGNIVNSAHLIDDIYTTKTAITFDKKLLYLTSTVDQNDNFNTYLFKLNQQLENDTIYSQSFTYDSLCPYQIENDTIVQDGCGLIVGDKEITAKPTFEKISIFPNPAQTSFTIQCSLFENNTCIIEVMDMLGRNVTHTISVPGTTSTQIDISGWQNGLYLVRISKKGKVVGSERVVVE